MELAVDQLDLEVHHWVAGDGAARRRVLNALLDRGPPLLRDRAAEDLVNELESSAPRQPFEHAGSFGELAAAPCLFLVTSDNFGAAPESFEISDLGRMKLDFNTVPAFQFVHSDFNVSLSRARKQELICLGFAIKPQRQILLEHLVKGLREFVFVAARLCRYGKGDCRPGKMNCLINDWRSLIGKRIAGMGFSQLGHRDDITGVSFRDLLQRLALHHVERPESFVSVLGYVVNSRVGLNVAGENLEHVDSAGERIGYGLEH